MIKVTKDDILDSVANISSYPEIEVLEVFASLPAYIQRKLVADTMRKKLDAKHMALLEVYEAQCEDDMNALREFENCHEPVAGVVSHGSNLAITQHDEGVIARNRMAEIAPATLAELIKKRNQIAVDDLDSLIKDVAHKQEWTVTNTVKEVWFTLWKRGLTDRTYSYNKTQVLRGICGVGLLTAFIAVLKELDNA